jgi:hypothetical protein
MYTEAVNQKTDNIMTYRKRHIYIQWSTKHYTDNYKLRTPITMQNSGYGKQFLIH